MLNFTLDTSCVIHSVQSQSWAQEIDALVELARSSKIGLSLSSAFHIDLEKASDENHAKNLTWLGERSVIQVVPQPFRLDHSPLDNLGFVLASDDQAVVASQLENIVLTPEYRVGQLDANNEDQMRRWRRKVSDVQHLSAHYICGNDAFITSDHDDMLKKREAIRSTTGIVIVDPAEALVMATR